MWKWVISAIKFFANISASVWLSLTPTCEVGMWVCVCVGVWMCGCVDVWLCHAWVAGGAWRGSTDASGSSIWHGYPLSFRHGKLLLLLLPTEVLQLRWRKKKPSCEFEPFLSPLTPLLLASLAAFNKEAAFQFSALQAVNGSRRGCFSIFVWFHFSYFTLFNLSTSRELCLYDTKATFVSHCIFFALIKLLLLARRKTQSSLIFMQDVCSFFTSWCIFEGFYVTFQKVN